MAKTWCRWSRVRPDGKRSCPECGNHYRALLVEAACVAHFDYATRRWCPGGKAPTAAQKAGRKRKRSVRATSGGLPSLGK